MNEWIALWTENVERSFRCKQLYMNACKNSAQYKTRVDQVGDETFEHSLKTDIERERVRKARKISASVTTQTPATTSKFRAGFAKCSSKPGAKLIQGECLPIAAI